MNSCVYESRLLKKHFILRTIGISYSKKIENLGKINLYKLFTFFHTFFALLYQVVIFRPAVIYFQISPTKSAFLRDSIYILLIKLFRKNIIFHLHGQGIKEEAQKSKLKKILYKFVFSESYIICLSDLLIKDIEDVFSGKIYILNNAIKKIDSLDLVAHKSENVSLLFLSNLIIKKGIFDFIDALKILASKNIDFLARIVGSEKDISGNELIKVLQERQLGDKVQFVGPKYGHEKEEIYLNSDIFIFPTHYDVWGLVILEAMQTGLPVISTAEGAIPEIVHDGVTGFLVEKQNPKALADKIEILIKDKELREKMGRAGRKKFLGKYTLDIFEKNLKNVFDEVLSEN